MVCRGPDGSAAAGDADLGDQPWNMTGPALSSVGSRPPATEAPAAPVQRALPPAWRALGVGALVIPLSAFFGIYSYEVVQALHWTMQSLKCGPIFVLFLVMVGNLILRRFARRFALTQAELVVVYAMVVTATAIGGVGSVQHIVAGLAAP